MKTNLKIFCGVWVFAIIASARAATTTSGITNKSSQFSDVLSEMGASATDSSNAELAETIRRQRALLDAAATSSDTAGGTSNITNANACDSALRKCMTEKCGTDFTKCASDSTTVWGNKMDACRRNTKCTGHEYTLLAPEILADRNAAIELSYYNLVVNCGNKYNNCIFGICGKTLDKCLSKSAGDSAMTKCKSIADECKEYDNGLVGRISGVFGDLRTVATADAQKQEKRLYELRDLMRTQCTRLGAMFDERTLDCVYTVNFFAGEDSTLMASKKLYSGDTFQCTPDWFGVDITTYMENAQRLTRSQTSASAAAMGAGLGTAAGLWTSGAVTRGIDTQNAEKQAKAACENDGGEWVSAGFNKGKTCDMSKPKADCERQGYTWDDKTGCSGGNTGTPDRNNGNPNSSNGGGSNPGETPCEAYSNMSSYICESKNCEWNNTTKQCTKPNAQQNTKTDSSNEEKNTNTKPDNKNSIITPSLTSTAQSIDESIQENIDQTCQTTCQSLEKKLDSPKIINLNKPACRDMCKQIIEAKCKTFETQLKTSQVTVSCNNETCNYTCKLIEKEKPTINCTEFDENNCLSNQTNGCEWTTAGCKQKTQIKASSITSMQKTSDDCPGCKSALKFDTATYTCSSNEEGKYAMYNGYIYVCNNNNWKGPDLTNYFEKIKHCSKLFNTRRYQAAGKNTDGQTITYNFDASTIHTNNTNKDYGAYEVTRICIE